MTAHEFEHTIKEIAILLERLRHGIDETLRREHLKMETTHDEIEKIKSHVDLIFLEARPFMKD